MRKITLLILIVIGLFALSGIFVLGSKYFLFQPTSTTTPPGVTTTTDIPQKDIETIAQDLQIPWGIAFLPNDDILLTERPGNLLKISLNPPSQITIPIPEATPHGEGGLLGIALHPDFSQNHFIYLYLTTQTSAGFQNRVERYTFINDQLSNQTIIIDNIPGAQYHDGGQLRFGPDGYLYITTGDATKSNNAQNLSSVSGKILRLRDDGSIPDDNPFNSAVYSYGHRNPQGLTWDDQGRLWATEHGRSGLTSGLDELNLIQKGQNYGWPTIQGDETHAQMQTPIINSGPNETWAPADIVYLDGSLFFTGLRGESLYEATLDDQGHVSNFIAHFRQEFGRLRGLELGPDGYLYLTTSNTDGRGTAQANDDKLIRINPEIFHSLQN